jgi:threonine/homoserine/homoserine lactone efflux protein
VLAAIVQSLPIAVGFVFAAAPMVILAVVLVSKRPMGVSHGFLGGWVLGLIVVGAAALALADGVTLAEEPSWWASILKITLGVVLGFLGARKWLGRPRGGDQPKVPRWMAVADTITAGKAIGLGFLLATVNPKHLVLVVAGVAVIADATPRVHEQITALVVFVVVASLGVAAPTVARHALGTRSDDVLASVDEWMTRNNAVIMSVVLLILGLILVGNGIAGL